MAYIKITSAVAITAFVLSATSLYAQAGGPDVPSDAKAQGTMENGSSSTGMSKDKAMEKTGSMKSGSMEKGSMTKAGSEKKSVDKM